MDSTRPPAGCRLCGARLAAGAEWCARCYEPVRPGHDPQPAARPSPYDGSGGGAAIPYQRRGPGPRTGRLVGGEISAEVLDTLAARLGEQVRADDPALPRGRPAVLAAVGAVLVLGVLLVGMSVVGHLL